MQQPPLILAQIATSMHFLCVLLMARASTRAPIAVTGSSTGSAVRSSRSINTTFAVTKDISKLWLLSARRGYCGVTESGVKGLCTFGDQGSFGGLALDKLLHARNWSDGTIWSVATACLEQCAQCERCRFVTLNLGKAYDCSWFSSCKLSHLALGKGHISARVPWAHDALQATPPDWQPRCPRHTGGARQHADGGAGSCGRGLGERATVALVQRHVARLRQWAACNVEATVVQRRWEVRRRWAVQLISFTDQQLISNIPLAAASFEPRSAAARAVVAAAPCLTPACVARALAGKALAADPITLTLTLTPTLTLTLTLTPTPLPPLVAYAVDGGGTTMSVPAAH